MNRIRIIPLVYLSTLSLQAKNALTLDLSKWAIQDSNLTSVNLAGDIETAENKESSLGGVSKSASLVDESVQVEYLLKIFNRLSQEQQSEVLIAIKEEYGGTL